MSSSTTEFNIPSFILGALAAYVLLSHFRLLKAEDDMVVSPDSLGAQSLVPQDQAPPNPKSILPSASLNRRGGLASRQNPILTPLPTPQAPVIPAPTPVPVPTPAPAPVVKPTPAAQKPAPAPAPKAVLKGSLFGGSPDPLFPEVSYDNSNSLVQPGR